jgi:hypothetical protein
MNEKELNLDNQIAEAEKALADLKNQKAKQEEEKRLVERDNRKADAQKVEVAFRAMNTARKNYNDVEAKAKRDFNKKVLEAKKVYNDAISEEAKKVDEAQANYQTELREFQKNHKDYHLTLRDPDNDCTQTLISNSFDKDFMDSIFNFFDRIW